MAYATTTLIEASEIPVIDITAIRGIASRGQLETTGTQVPAVLREVADQIRQAAQDVGFFYVSGHGVPAEILQAANRVSREFFRQSQAEKEKVRINDHHRGFLAVGEAQMYGAKHVDLKESWVWGIEREDLPATPRADDEFLGHNQWPKQPAEFQSAMVGFFNDASSVAMDLMSAFAVSMNLPADTFLKTATAPVSRGASVYYPPQPEALGEEQFGVAPHTDYGCLTLVWQDDTGGLEVRASDGRWVTAHPIENTFVVNVGDLLARWTNQSFKSTPHRVVNRSGRERCSMALFWDPDADTIIDPADVVIAGDKVRYQPTTVGEHILKRYGQSFAYRKS